MEIRKVFCTTREAASLLGIAIGTAQLWVDNGTLVGWRTAGGHRRVTRDSIEKILFKETGVPVARHLPPAVEPLRILAVEDDRNLRLLYETVLPNWPMAPYVKITDNGINALLCIEEMRPDLLLVDLGITGVDGFEMLKILRKHAQYNCIEVVVVTGMGPAEIANRGGLPPNIVVLPKPVFMDQLLDIANRVWAEKTLATDRALVS